MQSYVDNGYFKFFFDIKECEKILVIDNTEGGMTLAMAPFARIVICFCENFQIASEIKKRVEDNLFINVFIVVGNQVSLPFTECCFSNICLHRTSSERILEKLSEISLNNFVMEMMRILSIQGTLYISFLKKYQKRWPDLKFNYAIYRFLKKLKRYELHLNGFVYHYKSFYELFFIRACWINEKYKIKNIYFQLKASLFYNNTGLILKKGKRVKIPQRTDYINKLKNEIQEKLSLKLSSSSLLRIGAGESAVVDFGSVIVRIPQSDLGKKKCQNSMRILQNLEKICLSIKVPQIMTCGELDGINYYVENKLPGISLDLNKISRKSMGLIEKDAFNFLTDKQFIITGSISSEEFVFLMEEQIKKLQASVKEEDFEYFDKLILWIKKRIGNSSIPQVLQHGDFKESNFLCSHGFKKRLVGIIDWDMAAMEGVPLIDLLTMLTMSGYRAGCWKGSFIKQMWTMVNISEKHNFVDAYMIRMGIASCYLIPLTFYTMMWYLNEFFQYDDDRNDHEWYPTMISGCLLPAIKDYIE